jgi:hypothetical protein
MASLAGTVRSLRRDPDKVRQQLESFERSMEFFFSERERLLDAYENQWVAVFDGRVVANGRSLDSVLKMLKKMGVPPEEAFIQRVDREEQTLILSRDA